MKIPRDSKKEGQYGPTSLSTKGHVDVQHSSSPRKLSPNSSELHPPYTAAAISLDPYQKNLKMASLIICNPVVTLKKRDVPRSYSMAPSNLHPLRYLSRRISASVKQDTTLWTQTPLLKISPAADSLFNVTIDVSESPDLASSYSKPGQYLQLRLKIPDAKPSFLAIASPPSLASEKGVFEFLVKSVAGSTAEELCKMGKGDVVELSPAMGNGFNVGEISPPESYQSVLIFATGSGISPIRSLIEAGFDSDKRSDVRLYYGARNLNSMAYQERFKEWQSYGVKIVPVLSQPDSTWTGERGYVQAAFARDERPSSPESTGAVLCGQKQMAEEVTSALVTDGVPKEKILKNF